MSFVFYADLVLNLTLLIAMTILSGFLYRWFWCGSVPGALLQGLLFGAASFVGMIRPLVFGPGLIFDGRSVMIGLCALFFGPWAALACVALPLVYRFMLGGPGMIMGVLVISESALVGLAARRWLKPDQKQLRSGSLYLIGLIIHVIMLALTFTITDGSGMATLRNIGPTVIIAYPLAFILAGKILTDQLDMRRTLQALQQSEERFQLSMAATNDGLWDLDVSSDQAYYNPAYYRILGYTQGDFPAKGASWRELLHPDDSEQVLQKNQACIEGNTDFIESEYRMKARDGSWRWIYARGKCVNRDNTGRALRLVGTHVDITTRKILEEQLQQSIQEKDILLREVHHRVKNNLTIIASLLSLQEEAIKSPDDAITAFRNSKNRIFAMALVHNELYEATDYTHVDMELYLRNISDSILSNEAPPCAIDITVRADKLLLPLDTAIPCGMILNELITNACKHAFIGRSNGKIEISLTHQDTGWLHMQVADTGNGLPAGLVPEKATSLGFTLIRILVDQLGGSIEAVQTPKTDFHIRFPLR